MGSSASIFEPNSVLNDYNLKEKRFVAELTITGSATPTLKQHGVPDLPGVMLLRTEGQTSTVDAIETVAYTTPDDGPSNSIFGVMIRGGLGGLGDVKKILFIKVIDRSGTATSLTVQRHGSFGLTPDGNVVFSISAIGLDLTTENADLVIEMDYVTGENAQELAIIEGLGPDAVDLGTAGNYRILTESGITSAGTENIIGDIAVSPAAAASITGFALALDGGGQFSTSAEVTGQVFAADYAPPTPAELTQAVLDKGNAYTDAMSRTPDVSNFNGGDLGGANLPPGVYFFNTAITIPTNLTLTGGANDTWIFQSTGNLSIAASMSVNLVGGAVPSNVVWAVVAAAGLGASSTMRGTILSSTNITLGSAATVHGKLYAGTSVTMIGNTVTS